MKDPAPLTEATRGRLQELRNALLRLHKLLMDREYSSYEQSQGRVSKLELLQMLFRNEQFAWLRPMSQLVVQIDESLVAEEPLTEGGARRLFGEVLWLLTPSEAGMGFEKKYFEALQESPEVILAHRQVTRLIDEGR